MAERRMFAKTVIDSDTFLDMPLTAQSLYFHFCMRADDDGFIINPRKLQRMVGATDSDSRALIDNGFLLEFDSGVVAIRHWRMHNYIRQDRRRETVCTSELAELTEDGNGIYVPRSQCDRQHDNQVSTSCPSTVPQGDNQASTSCPSTVPQFDRSLTAQDRLEIGQVNNNIYSSFNSVCVSATGVETPPPTPPTPTPAPTEGKDASFCSSLSATENDSKRKQDGKSEPIKTVNRFVKPTLEQVQAYCKERGNSVDAKRFIDHYESNGWRVGRNPMRDWMAAVRNWERQETFKPSDATRPPPDRGKLGKQDMFYYSGQRNIKNEDVADRFVNLDEEVFA